MIGCDVFYRGDAPRVKLTSAAGCAIMEPHQNYSLPAAKDVMPNDTPLLVSPSWLATHLNNPRVRIVDVRWYLPHLGKSGAGEFAVAHVEGAVYVDVDTELAAPRGSGPGRHPLPDMAVFEAAMRRAGVTPDTHVVAYDDNSGTAARLWWLLQYTGHPRASLLDGGIDAWREEGHPMETGAGRTYPPGQFTARPQPGWVVDKTAVADLSGRPGALLLDARARERYEGRVEPIDARPGHIPGARSAPFVENLGHDGRFLSPDTLRVRYAALGIDKAETLVAYCGSGVTACHDIFALRLAGRDDTLLYEGSWSDWAADPALPAALGVEA